MHCHICDRNLSDPEVVFNKVLGEYEPCTTCLTAALDAAYTNGFSPDYDPYLDGENEGEKSGAVDTLEPDFGLSDFFGVCSAPFGEDSD
jgi:hypothetical protein